MHNLAGSPKWNDTPGVRDRDVNMRESARRLAVRLKADGMSEGAAWRAALSRGLPDEPAAKAAFMRAWGSAE